MKIVITGGRGFIGTNIAKYFKARHHDWELVSVDWKPDDELVYDDLFDRHIQDCFAARPAMDEYSGADVIIHLAAYTTVQESVRDPERSFQNNVVKTQHLLERLRQYSPKTKLIFASTGGAIIGDYDGAINESIVPRPLSPYGATKLSVEGMLSAYQGSYGMSSVSLRFSNVYGPYSAHKSSVVSAFCKSYLNSGRLQVNGDGLQTRDYIYVDDVCDVIYKVVQSNSTGVFQLGTGVATSILDIVKIFEQCGLQESTEVVWAPSLSGEVRHNCADTTRLKEELQFGGCVPINAGIPKTLEWFKNYLD